MFLDGVNFTCQDVQRIILLSSSDSSDSFHSLLSKQLKQAVSTSRQHIQLKEGFSIWSRKEGNICDIYDNSYGDLL